MIFRRGLHGGRPQKVDLEFRFHSRRFSNLVEIKKEKTVVHSTIEAEYAAMTYATKEMVELQCIGLKRSRHVW